MDGAWVLAQDVDGRRRVEVGDEWEPVLDVVERAVRGGRTVAIEMTFRDLAKFACEAGPHRMRIHGNGTSWMYVSAWNMVPVTGV